jgi:hypothetical protein
MHPPKFLLLVDFYLVYSKIGTALHTSLLESLDCFLVFAIDPVGVWQPKRQMNQPLRQGGNQLSIGLIGNVQL